MKKCLFIVVVLALCILVLFNSKKIYITGIFHVVFNCVLLTINEPINLTAQCIIFYRGLFSLQGRLGP